MWKYPRETYVFSIRIHETPSELAKAGIKQRCNVGAYPLANVLRSPAGTPNGTATGRRTITTVSPAPFLLFPSLPPSDEKNPPHARSHSLGLGVLQDYTKLKADTQAKNIAAWTPVVAEILHGFCKFDDKAVCPAFFLHP
jgi:hypothetical protein